VLRRIGDLTLAEAQARVLAGVDAGALLDVLRRERRAIVVRIAGEERWIAADDAGLHRDALGVVPPGGLPQAFVAEVDGALEKLVARYARTHGPFTTAELRDRYGVDPTPALIALENGGDLVRGELRPGGSEREWCDADVLRRIRRASLAVLRQEIEAVDPRALASFLPSWQGVDRHPAAGAGVDRLREALVPLQGLALPAQVWERDVLPRRVGAYSPAWLDQLAASGEVVWVGAGASGRGAGRVALYFRDDAAAIGPPPVKGPAPEPPAEPVHEALRERLGASPCFFTDLLAELSGFAPEELQDGLWDLVWAGEATNDAFAPLRAPRLTLARAQRAQQRRAGPGRRFGARRGGAQATVQGRW
jgi:ATP-dependent Lhr-like helicase